MNRSLCVLMLSSAFCLASIVAFAAPVAPSSAESQTYLFQLAYDDAEQVISQALAEKGAGSKIAAGINGNRKDGLYSSNKPVTVEIRGLTFDKSSSRWSANLLFINEDGSVASAMPVAGRFDEVAEYPVLKRTVRGGELITQNDIELRDFPITRGRADAITIISDLVGKTPIRSISAARPIREVEISPPAVIKKDGIVQIRYKAAGMEISTSGQALDDGAIGQVISVRNLTSKKMVRAVIADAHTVNVIGTGTSLTQVTGASSYAAN